MSMEEDISNIGAKLTQIGATVTQLTSDQFNGNIDLEQVRVRTPFQGQASMANSTPVVIAADQTPIPVTGSFSAVGGATSVDQTNGQQKTQLVDSAFANTGTAVNPLRVDPTGSTTQPVTVTNAAGAAAVNIQDGGNSITVDGAFFPAIQSVSGSVSVSNFPVSQPVSGTVMAQGDVANDAVDSGNPVKIGGQARTTYPTAVSNGDRVNAIYDKMGRQVVTIATVREKIDQQTTTISNTTETAITTSVTDFQDLTSLIISNTSATGVIVDIRSSSGASVRLSLFSPAQSSISHHFSPPLPQIVASTNWTAQLSAAVTDVRIFTENIRNL